MEEEDGITPHTSQEFRKESVKFFKESGLTLVEAATRLSLPMGTLKNWIYAGLNLS